MADMIGTGMAWLNSTLKASASVAVTYRRDADSVELQATLGSQLLRSTDGRGSSKVERTDRDFLFAAADLVLGGETVLPASGDLVDYDGDRFEVMPYGSDPHWRYCDSSKNRIRVHTKYRGAAN